MSAKPSCTVMLAMLLGVWCMGPAAVQAQQEASQFWVDTEYLLWWTNGVELPPLLITNPPGTPVSDVGVFPPDGNSEIVYGDSTINSGVRSGFRVRPGVWIDDCHRWAFEAEYLTLGRESEDFSDSSSNLILGRPLYNVQLNREGAELVSYPGVLAGTFRSSASDYFDSAGAWLRWNLCQCCCEGTPLRFCPYTARPGEEACCAPYACRLDLLAGYRYAKLRDSLSIEEDLLSTQGPTNGFRYLVNDGFAARNDFHGGELGLRGQIEGARWSFDLTTRLAIGNTHQVVDIDGSTTITPTVGAPQTLDGGVFAVRSNEGTYVRDDFTVIPQLAVQVGYKVLPKVRLTAGYDLLYWAMVTRAADQYDLFVDPRNVPPTEDPALPFPAFPGRQSSFWAQGLSLGTEVMF